uniref:S-adenosylmethionine-dependent methyltransferase domain-containing protein n=1 Tax=Chromera velia CCMP2878 TaxID=1169474 RepID=A0A0G4H916_9ALVE|eukprot:Cvel_25132.t1-p1 / transcript=Cvel_25132.t1 / gene=Cvel_25132 / organism=Chromera_velia_CCMP2878 / gene_product=Ribosomal RNA large subunit methyltransferase I, putative / transcript_product=Ribosomal RNA large subunit methyltransferase I, putative / location=Cvel_scaffold2808:10313-15379(+) / protein_length=551 / sequence_SO=supercontig / SO=protein_coding / is_pseudo=false
MRCFHHNTLPCRLPPLLKRRREETALLSRRCLQTALSAHVRRDDPYRRPTLKLRPKCDRHLLRGSSWVWQSDIQNHGDLQRHSPCLVNVESADGEDRGVATYNRNSSIAARLLSHERFVRIDEAFFFDVLQRALKFRQRCFPEPFYRLIHAEADGLPGVVIDRYGDEVSMMINSAGMDGLSASLIRAVDECLKPRVIVLRNDSPVRKLEKLPLTKEVCKGQYAGATEVRENGCSFLVDLLEGQKTGWYFDQRDNRALLTGYAEGRDVLDLFAYTGGFGIQAAAYGASQVTCVDSSAPAVNFCKQNAALNAVASKVRVEKSCAFGWLEKATGTSYHKLKEQRKEERRKRAAAVSGALWSSDDEEEQEEEERKPEGKGRRSRESSAFVDSEVSEIQEPKIDYEERRNFSANSGGTVQGIRKESEEESMEHQEIQGGEMEDFRTPEAVAPQFDLIVIDPPPMARHVNLVYSALPRLRRLVAEASLLLREDGVLFVSSCSRAIDARTLLACAQRGVAVAGRRCQLIAQSGASPDHPVHPSIPETSYLSALTLRVF